jgi:hypothetical protein
MEYAMAGADEVNRETESAPLYLLAFL